MPKRRRILVTAPTNKAVGVLAKRFLESCPGLLEDHGIPLALIGVEDKLLEAESGTGGIFCGSGGSGSKGSKEEHSSSHPSCSFADAQLKRIFCYTWIDSLAKEYDQLLAQLEKESLSLPKPERCLPSSSAANRGVAAWLPRMLPPPSSHSRDYSFVVHSNSDSNTEDEGDDGSSSTAELERGKAPPDDHAAVHADTDTLCLLDKARGLHVRLVKNLPRLSESSGAADLSRKLIRCLAGRGSGSKQAPCIILRELLAILRNEHLNTGGFGGSNDGGDDYEGEAERGNLQAEAVPELLATARIVFCTLSTPGTSLMKQTRRVDDWIMDKAAAATEAELLIPLHLDPKRLLAVGDPMQLPASVASLLASKWGLRRSLHERLTVDLGRSQTMLDVQYRMKPEISKFPSHRFYEGRLTDGDNVLCANYGSSNPAVGSPGESGDGGGGAGMGHLLHSTPPWCFFQVDGTKRQSHSGSYYNIEEASAVVAFLKLIRLRSGFAAWNNKHRPHRHSPSWWRLPVALPTILFK